MSFPRSNTLSIEGRSSASPARTDTSLDVSERAGARRLHTLGTLRVVPEVAAHTSVRQPCEARTTIVAVVPATEYRAISPRMTIERVPAGSWGQPKPARAPAGTSPAPKVAPRT